MGQISEIERWQIIEHFLIGYEIEEIAVLFGK